MYMKLARTVLAERARGEKRDANRLDLPIGTGLPNSSNNDHRAGDGDDDGDDGKQGISAPARPTTITITLIRSESTIETVMTSMVSKSAIVSTTSVPVVSSTATSSAPSSFQSSAGFAVTPLSPSPPLPSPTISVLTSPIPTKGESSGGGHHDGSQSDTSPTQKSGSSGLPGGAIAGITIAALLIVIAVIILIIRKRLIRRRRNIRATWAPFTTESSFRSADISPPSYTTESYTTTATPYPVATFVTPQPQMSVNRVPVPPAMISPMSTGAVIPAALTPGRTPRLAIESLPVVTVVCSFIPTLQDELPIEAGERIRVMAEYDDGWGLCCNSQNQQGMVPLECLDRGTSRAESRDYRKFKRASSLHASLIPGERPYAAQW